MKLQTSYVHHAARAGSLWLALFMLMGAPFGLGAAAGLFRTNVGAGAMAMVACVAAMIYGGFALARGGRATAGAVEVSKAGVDFDGRTSLAREKIRAAAFTPRVGRRPSSVRFLGKYERELAWIEVKDHAHGDEVLSALGLAPNQASAQFYALAKRGTTGFWALIAAAIGATALSVGIAVLVGHAEAAYLGILPFALVSAYFMPAKIHVGADGLLYEMRVGSRFFPWSEVLEVQPIQKGIAVLLKSGEVYEIPTVSRGKMYYEYERVAQATLVSRANDALAAFDRGDVPDVSARVVRLGRTKEAWIAGLRDREGSFRDAPLRSEDLWKIVESPAAEVTARAGAAAVLAQEATEDDRARLRIAADACAEPRLRVVLDKAATGEDAMDALGDIDDSGSVERLDEREVHARR